MASIQIDKRDLTDPIAPQGMLMYYIRVSNAGPSTAKNLVVTDYLPAGLLFVGNTDSCLEGPSGVLTCKPGDLPAGATTSFLIMTLVDPTVVSGTILSNVAYVTSTTPLTNSVISDTE